MIVADTSGLLAYFNAAEPAHAAVVAVISDERDPLIVSPYVIAELDYLVATRIGSPAELAVLDELGSGAYELAAFDGPALHQAGSVIEKYSDQAIGLADASLVVLAQRYATRTVLTLDRRHFDVLRPLSGGRFKVIP
jgi:hypothetical protein